jgi:hypothetical protein
MRNHKHHGGEYYRQARWPTGGLRSFGLTDSKRVFVLKERRFDQIGSLGLSPVFHPPHCGLYFAQQHKLELHRPAHPTSWPRLDQKLVDRAQHQARAAAEFCGHLAKPGDETVVAAQFPRQLQDYKIALVKS